MPVPHPKFYTDFTNPDDPNNVPFELKRGAEIKEGAPGNVERALRIDRDGPYAILPDVDISPQSMQDCTISITFFLESIPSDSRGWLLNHDNGRFDRCIFLHDGRFNGIGHGVGYKTAGGVYANYTVPPIGKWIQMMMTYRQGGECAVFLSNEKAPITHIGRNNQGKKDLTIGCVDFLERHWCDCWVKELKIYDVGLSDEQVEEEFHKFQEEVQQPSTLPFTPIDPTTTPDVDEVEPTPSPDSGDGDDSNAPYIRPNAPTQPDSTDDEDVVEEETKPDKKKAVISRSMQKCCFLLLLIIILLLTSWDSLSGLLEKGVQA